MGGLLKLGAVRHHERYLEGIDSLEDDGCFGQTELGYGNNAVEMETNATYDPKTKEFVVNISSALGQKYWITNGVEHSKYVVVFVQLIFGEINH